MWDDRTLITDVLSADYRSSWQLNETRLYASTSIVYTYVCIYIYIEREIYCISLSLSTYIYIYTHTTYTYIHTYVYIYIYIHIHIHIHIHVHVDPHARRAHDPHVQHMLMRVYACIAPITNTRGLGASRQPFVDDATPSRAIYY